VETILGTIVFVLAVVWAFHIDTNTARTAESLKRIEKLLEKKEK
jgi:hypothetical protein